MRRTGSRAIGSAHRQLDERKRPRPLKSGSALHAPLTPSVALGPAGSGVERRIARPIPDGPKRSSRLADSPRHAFRFGWTYLAGI